MLTGSHSIRAEKNRGRSAASNKGRVMKNYALLLVGAILAICASVTRAQEDHAYTQGPVTIVSFIRTQPGMFEEYLRYLDNTYKKLVEQLKKQGAITGYA